jgi:hypothetical protein
VNPGGGGSRAEGAGLRAVLSTLPSPPALSALLLAAAACTPSPAPHGALARLETGYQTLRYWDDQRRLLGSLGVEVTPAGVAQSAVSDSLQAARASFGAELTATASAPLDSIERKARATMLDAWRNGLSAGPPATDGGRQDTGNGKPSGGSCDYHPAALGAGPGGLDRLTDRMYACYTTAANLLVVDGDTLNRLAILGRLARTDDAATRQRLFLALAPVWRSVNGDDREESPYRTLVMLRRRAWGDTASPIEAKGPAFGLTPAQMERWLTGALGQWRDAMPDRLLEPWDWYYYAGEAARRLSLAIPAVADIRRVNDAYYRSIGAPPESLGIHYDLAPRPGKDPVAFTDFGSRNHWVGGRLVPGEPWVFTAYLDGGFDNLGELLHETGHAIHIAAIRTRPAWVDWPDNDTFTEALADLAALELYEPRWQRRVLGESAPLEASLRAKYAGIVFDMTWALFEIQVHRRPGIDPDRLWSELTSEYLGIVPHPEWSWWAIRGQLIDGPGYLVNYALGAFITAHLRARAAARGHSFGGGGATLYPWLAGELYRFGQERSSRDVLERFLGGPVRPDPLLADLRRMVGGRPGVHR